MYFFGWLTRGSTKLFPHESVAQDPVNLDNFTEASLRRMSGNGMSLPCAGFVLLMAVLFVEDK
jgi:hypothetical protein